MDISQLATILSSTFDPGLRLEAEKKLQEINQQPGFVTLLLQVVMSNEIQAPVRQSGGIYLKNVIMQHWRERDPSDFPCGETPFVISDQDKVTIRDNIVEAVIHAPELIRLQLAVCIGQILRHDFPEKWPQIVDKINLYLNNENQSTWMGALLSLHQIVKKYEYHDSGSVILYKKPEERAVLDAAMQLMLPRLCQLCGAMMQDESLPAAEIQKQILKILFAFLQYFLPTNVITQQNFPQWMVLLQTVVDKPVPHSAMEHDEVDRPRLAWWKVKKWAMKIMCRVFERYGTPGSITSEYATFADFYCKNFAVSVSQILLKVLDQYRRKVYISPRVLQQTINYLKNGISNALHWKVMRPHLQAIIQEVIFPLMCYTEEDDELWNEDPYEFIRIKYDIFEDFVSPVAAAATFLHTAVSKRKQVLDPTMNFCVHLLNLPEDKRDPKQKDGVLHMIGTLGDILLKKKQYKNQLEPMLVQHVYPEFRSPMGYLRARACWVVHAVGEISFRDENNLAQAVNFSRLCLTEDKELPVKVEAGIALQFLIENQDQAKKYIEPYVRQVILELLRVIKETENDDLTSVMSKLITTYGDQEQVAGIAVDIAQELASTFLQLLESDESEEKAITAMGILNTLETMINVMESSKQIVSQLEHVVAGLIATVMQQSIMEFYEDILTIICTCTCFEISETMWHMYYLMFEMFERDGFDCFPEMMPCLHNYITVDTPAFLANQKNVEIIYSMCKKVLRDADEDTQCNAAKLLEVTVIQCHGQIDQWVPYFVEAALERLTREIATSELRTMCLQVGIAALFYNASLLLSTLEKLHFPNTEETVTAQFFSRWIGDADCFFGLHDRKMFVLGFCSLFLIPREERPQAVVQCTPQILPSLLLVFAGLKRAYEARGTDEEEEEEEEVENIEEDELSSDDDEINEDDVVYIEKLAQKVSDHLDDEEEDEETQLESYTSAIDDEGVADEYIAFKNALHSLQTNDPQWYSTLIAPLSSDEQNKLREVIAQADQRIAAQESRQIEAQGGFQFTSVAVPTTFNFGPN